MPRRKAMSFDQKRATIAGIILESVVRFVSVLFFLEIEIHNATY